MKWHRASGHMNTRCLKHLLNGENARERIKLSATKVKCAACLKGKIRHDDVQKMSVQDKFVATKPREKWYIDTIDPMEINSWNASNERCLQFEMSVTRLNEFYNLTGNDCKVLHTDNGTEIVNETLKEYVKDELVKFQS